MNACEQLTIREVAHGSPGYRATVELRDAVLRKPLGLRFSRAELDAERDGRHVACYLGDRVVGCLVLRPKGGGKVRMTQVAVAPDQQRRGIGAALVEFSEVLARKLGYKRVVLHARESAVAFYEKQDYARVGERFEEVTIPHWAMEKLL